MRSPSLRAIALLFVPLIAAAQPPYWDTYIAGVHVAEIREDGTLWTIRRKDFATNEWSAPHRVYRHQVAGDSLFRLWGALRRLPERLATFAEMRWSGMEAYGWPSREVVYGRARALTVPGTRSGNAVRWNEKDASAPMDIVVAGRRLVAAIDPRSDIVFVRRGDEGFTTVAAWKGSGVSAARHGYRALGKQMVPMADGVRLATLVYLPRGDDPGPYPAIFVRSPYGIGGLIGTYWRYAARGYAVVLQATRGTSFSDPANRSEGELELMVHEPADGKAALDWVASQPWSNGSICMQGGSYLGYTQWTAAMSGHPALRCLVPEVSMGTAFADQPYVGGGLLVGMAYYQFFMHARSLLPGRTWTEVIAHRPLVDLDSFATGTNLPNWDMQVLNATNGDYWRRQDWHRGNVRPGLATFQLSGWFDDDLPGTLSNWSLMQRIGTAPQRLLLGPWKHGYNTDRRLNGYSFGLEALRDDIWLLKQQWYDAHLKGMRNASTGTRVEYFVLGDNAWRSASAWPPPEAEAQRWYFHGDGRAVQSAVGGTLARAAPTGDEPVERYIYDPADPPRNWMTFEQLQRWEDVQTFPFDMRELEARPDVVTFTSAPLAQDLTIAGDILVELHAGTDAKDTDWWVHVSDVDPTGRSNRLTLGALRARFRDLRDPQYRTGDGDFSRAVLLSGDLNDVVRYRIGIKGIANTFKRGHRIRIAVMNAMANYTFPNSNTGGDEGRVTTTVPAQVAIHHSRLYPSHVVLPVLPRRAGSARVPR
jgi:putative CocE/NonD family hydrolase